MGIVPGTVLNPPSSPRERKYQSHTKGVKVHFLGTVYKAKAPPRATPAMAMTAVRNGSCSVTIGAELGLLVEEVDDDDDDDDAVEPAWALAPVPEAVEEVPHSEALS